MRKLHIALGVPALAVTLAVSALPAAASPAADATTASVPARYANQKIDWQPCFPEGAPPGLPAGSDRLQCGSFLAPRNWYRPNDKVDVTVAVTKLPSTGTAKGAVFTNPGGPGGPGRSLPLSFISRPKLLGNEDIIGIDPRGTGGSTNVTCGGQSSLGSELDPRDRSRANLDLILNANKLIAQYCQTRSGELGKYVNTEQTVRDLDLLRALLNRPKINWVGYSGGTWLGAQYATTFPSRVGAFVLDSNTEFTTGWEESFNWQPLGFERRWREDFLVWAAKYDSLYHLGATAEAARQTYEQTRAKLAQNPVQGLTASLFDFSIVPSLYSKQDFPALADFLVTVRDLVSQPANAAQLAAKVAAYRAQLVQSPMPMAPVDYEDAFPASFVSITCNDTPWYGDRQSQVRLSEQLGRKYPLIGWSWVAQPCIFWNRPNVNLPQVTGRGLPSILMVQSTHDPATPYEGAQKAHRGLANSRMITVTGEGDHGIYAFTGNKCVDDIVENFIVDGRAPTHDLTCAGMPLPAPAVQSEKSGLVKAMKVEQQAGELPR
jgi:pimeloyl-ACP methyl ester carboxylesterase